MPGNGSRDAHVLQECAAVAGKYCSFGELDWEQNLLIFSLHIPESPFILYIPESPFSIIQGADRIKLHSRKHEISALMAFLCLSEPHRHRKRRLPDRLCKQGLVTCLRHCTSELQVRMPISDNLSDRNFVTKIARYVPLRTKRESGKRETQQRAQEYVYYSLSTPPPRPPALPLSLLS